jgi:hypothetical protein
MELDPPDLGNDREGQGKAYRARFAQSMRLKVKERLGKVSRACWLELDEALCRLYHLEDRSPVLGCTAQYQCAWRPFQERFRHLRL